VDPEKRKELSTNLSRLRGYLKNRDIGYATDVFSCLAGILDVLDGMRHEGGIEKDVAQVMKEAGLPKGFSDIAEKLIIALSQSAKLLNAMQELFERTDKDLKNV
jgi:hypothetical protein